MPRSAALEALLSGPGEARLDAPLRETQQILLDVKFMTTLDLDFRQIDWKQSGLGTLVTLSGEVPFVESEDTLDGLGVGFNMRWRCPCLGDDQSINDGYGFAGFNGNWLSGNASGDKLAGNGNDFALTYFLDSPGGATGVNFGDTAATGEFDIDQYALGFTLGAGRVIALDDYTDVDLQLGIFARQTDTMYDGWASSVTFPGNMIAYEYDIEELNIGMSFGAEFSRRIVDTPFSVFAGFKGGVYYADADMDADMDVMVPVNPTVADRVFSQSVDDDEDFWGVSADLRVGLEYRRDNFSARIYVGYGYRSDVATLDSKDSPIDSGPSIDRDDMDGFVIGTGFTLSF